ncbi:MAG: hypothetical protein K0U68_02230, partial [Gammaproteobacteria bacterium]|nr:hypothetical protein [Gammaproteobacteria bacterium]
MQGIRSVVGCVLLLFCYCSLVQAAETETPLTQLTIHFPGLSSVHTEVRESDLVSGSASGPILKKLNWKSDSVTTEIEQGTFDLVVKKGEARLILDEIKCLDATCTVNVPLAVLTVNFPELSSVHTSVRVTDGIMDSAEGGESTKANWKKDQAEIVVLQGVYDLLVRKGASSQVIDNVQCTSALCSVDVPIITMTIDFPGLSAVHNSIRLDDGIDQSASGEEVNKANWKKDQASMRLFPGVYDIHARYGASSQVVDAVNCLTGDCQINLPLSQLTVDFPGFKGLHTYVKLTDGISDSATGEEAAKAKWKTDQAKLAVFPGVYDLAIEHSNSSLVIDAVNCVNSECQTNVPTANLKVLFPGMSKVHTYVKQPDDNNDTASGAQVAKATWKTDEAELQLLPGIYDVLIEFGAASQVINNVDCSGQTCEVDLSSAELTVNFPDMKSVHTYVMKSDGEPGTANGEQVTKAKWKTDLAQLTVLPGVYDLLIEHGVTSQVIDNVNCSNGKCTVDVP